MCITAFVGSSSVLVSIDLGEVCPLSRWGTLNPISTSLLSGIRFFPLPLPAPPLVPLAVFLPLVRNGTGLPCSVRMTVMV